MQSRSLGGSTNNSTGVIFLNIITDLIGSHRRLESKRQGNEIHCRAPHLGFFRLVKCERGAEIYQVISDFIKLSGRGGYAGKEVMKSNLCTAIFHKESVVCTLKCHRSSLFIGHFHFCSVFEGATVFRQRRVHSYCLGQVSKTPAGKSTSEGCTIHKTGVKFF